jgi:copper oxidase (laccase) domain-containing protein
MPIDAPATNDDDPLPFWRPPAGALPAGAWFGMTTRRGGESTGAYAAFNVSLGVGDDERAVIRNRERLARALGYPGTTPALLNQVHGARIVVHREAPAEADGFLVGAGEPWVAVSAADCAPVAIVSQAVRRLADRVPPGELTAVIGPCIHACCFPVGPDVALQFDATLRRPHPSGQEAIDLPGAIRRSLVASGVPDERIHAASECTSCERATFYSHRRDRGITGRHWAFLRLA